MADRQREIRKSHGVIVMVLKKCLPHIVRIELLQCEPALVRIWQIPGVCCSVLQLCCNVVQCGAVCCSVLQCVAACYSVLQRVTMCGSVVQWCSMVQCEVAWCSMLQCGVVCFTVIVMVLREQLPKCDVLREYSSETVDQMQ